MIDEVGIWTGATVKNSEGNIFEVKDIALIVHKSYDFENESWDKEMTPIISMKGAFGEEVSLSFEKLKQEYTWYKEPKVRLPELLSVWENVKFGEVCQVLSAFEDIIKVRYEGEVIIRVYTRNYFFDNFMEVNKQNKD